MYDLGPFACGYCGEICLSVTGAKEHMLAQHPNEVVWARLSIGPAITYAHDTIGWAVIQDYAHHIN